MLYLKKISTCFLLFFFSLGAQAKEEWYSFEPAEVTLSGKIIYQDFFGPPNYGENPETDSVETVVILVLYQPINVRGDPQDDLNSKTVTDIARLQLVVTLEKIGKENLSGKNVIVRGHLFTKHTGHHRTEVLMMVNEFEISP